MEGKHTRSDKVLVVPFGVEVVMRLHVVLIVMRNSHIVVIGDVAKTDAFSDALDERWC